MKFGERFGHGSHGLFRAMAAVLIAGGICDTVIGQVSPGDRPARRRASFPNPGPVSPPIVITRPNIPRAGLGPSVNALPRRSDALPGGGLRRDTSKLYRPVPAVTGAQPVRTVAPPTRGDFGGPGVVGSGVPVGVRRGPGPVVGGTTGSAFFDGSGFSGNLAYSGDRWRFAAHLGSGVAGFGHSACLDGLNFCPPACLPIGGLTWPYLSWPYNHGYCYPGYPSYYGYVYGSSWPVVNYAVDQYADPALSPRYIPQQIPAAAPPPPPALTAMELATLLMQERRYAEAAEHLRSHLRSDPGDSLAQRWLGVAQLLAGRIKDGCATVAKAYENDAALGDSILKIDDMGISQIRVRELCGPVVAYAKRSGEAGAFVTAAMLMQVRDRADLSIKMLSEAKTAGLDPELYAKLSQSMTK